MWSGKRKEGGSEEGGARSERREKCLAENERHEQRKAGEAQKYKKDSGDKEK